MPDSPSLYEIQKTALCGTAQHLRRVLSMGLKNITPKEAAKSIKSITQPSPTLGRGKLVT